jgi:hypothetical protein
MVRILSEKNTESERFLMDGVSAEQSSVVLMELVETMAERGRFMALRRVDVVSVR